MRIAFIAGAFWIVVNVLNFGVVFGYVGGVCCFIFFFVLLVMILYLM